MSKYPIIKDNTEPLSVSVAQFLPHVTWNVKDTCHPTWLFFWNPKGTVRLVFKGNTFELGQEYAVLIPPNTYISAYSDESFSHLYAHFNAGSIFNCVKNHPYFLPMETAQKYYQKLELQQPQWRKEIYWQLLLLEYLMMLGPEAFGKPEHARMDSRIEKAIRFCEKKVQNLPDNTELARYAGMSVNNFYRVFLRETGMSPTHYKNHLRLSFARKMLLESSARIPEIAELCGYANRYQFSKAFKKCFGMTPAVIRQKVMIGNP